MATFAQKDSQLQYQEDSDQYYSQDRLTFIKWIKPLAILSILVAIAQIVLTSIHIAISSSNFLVLLLICGVLFFIGSILAIVWAFHSEKHYQASEQLFQPSVNDTLTKALFIAGLLLAGASIVILVNLFIQFEYTPDFLKAQSSVPSIWNAAHSRSNTLEDLTGFVHKHFITESCFMGFFFFFFLLASRAAFKCLKYDNQAMSYIVFIGCTFLIGFALCLSFYVERAFGYDEFPQLRAHFPVWNIRGLQYVGFALIVLAITGFFVDHRSWRIGFFALAFIMLVFLTFLVNFTGFAYRHTRQTYEYYKGVQDLSICQNRLYLVHYQDLENYGCPNKYLPADRCSANERQQAWEPPLPPTGDKSGLNTFSGEPSAKQQNRASGSSTVTTTQGTSTMFLMETENMVSDEARIMQDSSYNQNDYYCLNTNCCGLLGELYTRHLLRLSNFGLLSILAGCLVSIGCYYFWYVAWVDVARDKRKDFIWLGIMAALVVAFAIVVFTVNPMFIREKLGTDKTHL